VQTKKHSLFQQVIGYIPGTIIPLIFGLFFTIIFTRIISAEEFGRFNLQMSGATFLVALLSQWLQQSTNRYFPRCDGTSEVELLRGAFSIGIFLNSAILMIGYIVVKHLFRLDMKMLPWSAVLLALGMSIFIPLSVVFQANRKPREYSLFVSLSAIGKVLFSVALVYGIGRYAGSLILGTAISYLLIVPWMWHSAGLVVSPKSLENRWDPKARAYLGQFLRYGLPLSIWFLLFNFLLFGDRFVVAHFIGNSAVGVYSAGFSLMLGGAGLVATPILLGAHPTLIHAWERGEIERVKQLIPQIIRLASLIGLVIIGGLFLLAQGVARVFMGPAFQSSAPLMPYMMVGVVLSQVAIYAHKPLEFGERCWEMVGGMAFACAVALSVNWVFVPRFGFRIAPFAMSAGFMVYSGCAWYLGRKVLAWRVPWLTMATDLVLVALAVWISRLVQHGVYDSVPKLVGAGLSVLLYGCFTLVILFLRGGRSILRANL
jgi:O-antigen/teichoic acid export membrane protein